MTPRNETIAGVVGVSSTGYIQTTLTLLANGRVVVPLRNGDDSYRIENAGVDEIIEPAPGGGWITPQRLSRDDDDTALIMFSSGTEGEPKGVRLSHRALADVVARLNATMGVDATIREYLGIPPYLSFGFGRCRAVAQVGGALYVPRNGFDPTEIGRMLAEGEINALSAVPSLLRILLQAPETVAAGADRLRWMEIGSQYLSRGEKEDLKALFPNARIVQHYGLTEASRSTFLVVHDTEGEHLESVGRPVGETQVRISADNRIEIRGPHVAAGLIVGGQEVSCTDRDGWLRTGDLGEIRDGFLYFKGRADDLINISGLKVSPEIVESRMRKDLGVDKGIAVCRIPDRMCGDRLLVATSAEIEVPQERLRGALESATADLGEGIAGGAKYIQFERLPATDSDKVQRKRISEMFLADSAECVDDIHLANQVRAAFSDVLGGPRPALSASFADLSDDPAARRRLAGALESLLGPLPPTWERLGIRDLTRASHRAAQQQTATAAGRDRPGYRAPTTDEERKLVTIWEEVLGFSPIGVDDSFFEVGGDSLSAISVMLHMRKHGLDEATCRSVFRGRTIAELARKDAASPTADAMLDSPILRTNLVVNAARGILVLLVLLAHWSPGVVERIPALKEYFPLLYPVFGMGTPGFGIVFGITIGYTYYSMALERPNLLWQRVRFGAGFVGGAILILGLSNLATHDVRSATDFFNMFYSVLDYYFFGILSIPLILGLLKRFPSFIVGCLTLSALCFGIDLLLHTHVSPLRGTGPLELGKLILAAKYGYFNMTGGVLLGTAIGYLLYAHRGKTFLVPLLVAAGLALPLSGIAVSLALDQSHVWLETSSFVHFWKWLTYSGFVLLLLAALSAVIGSGAGLSRPTRHLLFVFGSLGQLALFAYVGHALVIPIKDLLLMPGVPYPVALAIPMLGFFVSLFVLGRKVYRLNYA